jgi:ABC-type transport system involved in multi-copper enzyme maturation permease subunit
MPIFDQGYQHWHGPLSGHSWRWLSIARQGTRVQMKARRLRACVVLAWLPALGLVIFMALWGLLEKKTAGLVALVQAFLPADVLADPGAYRSPVWTIAYSFFFKTEMFFIMVLVAVAGPDLISGDLRFNALPLYLSRPLNRLDYFLGKLGVIGALVASVAVLPAVVAYLIGLCFSLDVGVLKDTWWLPLAAIAFGLVVTLSAGSLILAMSSLTRRSLYVGIAWAGLWIISGSVGGTLTEMHRESVATEAKQDEVNVYADYMEKWQNANPPPPGVRVPAGMPKIAAFPGRRPAGAPAKVEPPPQRDPWLDARDEASREAQIKARNSRVDEVRKDWRPLLSYVGNLERISDSLFDTDSAWVKLGDVLGRAEAASSGMVELAPLTGRERADRMVPQYPWQWSAGVLVGLMGLSTWTLARRVRSLDRLK